MDLGIDLAYGLWFVLLLFINTTFYLIISIICLIKKYYNKYKILFFSTLVILTIIAIIIYITANGWFIDLPKIYNDVSVILTNIFSTLIPIIIAYWIHLTSKNKTRDYIILSIIFVPLVVFFVYAIYMIYFW